MFALHHLPNKSTAELRAVCLWATHSMWCIHYLCLNEMADCMIQWITDMEVSLFIPELIFDLVQIVWMNDSFYDCPLFTLTTYWRYNVLKGSWKFLFKQYFSSLYSVSYLNDKHLLHAKVSQPSFSHICARCAVYRRLTSDHRHYIKTRFWEVLSELTTLCRIINWHDSLV